MFCAGDIVQFNRKEADVLMVRGERIVIREKDNLPRWIFLETYPPRIVGIELLIKHQRLARMPETLLLRYAGAR